MPFEQLVQNRKIFCCKITKAGRSFNAYWLSFHVAQPKRNTSFGTLFPSRRIKPRQHVKHRKPALLGDQILPDRWCKSCEMKHPATEFAHSQSRRCIPSNLIYEQNKREIQLERVRQWRAKKKTVQANNQRPNNEN